MLRPGDIAFLWAARVTNEFFQQTDKERALGLPVTSFMVQNTTKKGKSYNFSFEFVSHSKTIHSLIQILYSKVKLKELF